MAPIRILIINPNTDQSMTDSLREPIESLGYNNTTYTYLTSSSSHGGISSINSLADAHVSATHTLPSIIPLIRSNDAFLIACYSPHPLVGLVRGEIERMGQQQEEEGKEEGRGKEKPVLGIMEASVLVAMGLLAGSGSGSGSGSGGKRFGIVTTGQGWKSVLEGAVAGLLGAGTTGSSGSGTGCGEGEEGKIVGGSVGGRWFKGVECCGVDAGGLHNGAGDVEGRVRGAVRRLVDVRRRDGDGDGDGEEKGQGELGVVVLGCAGMVGMEGWVREEVGEGVRVVDGVKAGVGMLQGLVRGGS